MLFSWLICFGGLLWCFGYCLVEWVYRPRADFDSSCMSGSRKKVSSHTRNVWRI